MYSYAWLRKWMTRLKITTSDEYIIHNEVELPSKYLNKKSLSKDQDFKYKRRKIQQNNMQNFADVVLEQTMTNRDKIPSIGDQIQELNQLKDIGRFNYDILKLLFSEHFEWFELRFQRFHHLLLFDISNMKQKPKKNPERRSRYGQFQGLPIQKPGRWFHLFKIVQ